MSFYRNSKTGALEPKYLLILATLPSDDIVARLLTSRPHGRPENPRCFHGYPYSGFYLGVIGGSLAGHVLSEVLECVAAADDTSQVQERAIRDVIERLR